MAASPRSPGSPARSETAGGRGVPISFPDHADEVTPIFASPSDRNLNYQTTQLTTHREAMNEETEDTENEYAEAQTEPLNAKARQASSTSIRSASQKQRNGRLNNSMRRASDRSSLRGRRPGSTGGGRAGDESEEGSDGQEASIRRRGRLRKWWRRKFDKYSSVELDNKGSVARDHLALERTFLAWLRTSLSFASIGIAITQLFRLNTTITDREGLVPDPAENQGFVRLRQMGKPLGATFLAIAIVVLLVGSRRYFESQHWIIRGKFPASRGSVLLITVIAVALIIGSLTVILIVNPTQFET